MFTAEKYTKYVNGELIDEFIYKIELGNTIRKSEDSYLIIYEPEKKQSIELIDNKLVLFDECYDCFVYEYKRK